METAVIVCIIAISILIVCVIVLLGVLFYNQMLVTNEINKRLLLLTKESIDKERSSQEELNDALLVLERQASAQSSTTLNENKLIEDEEEVFNPHTYNEE